MKGFCKCDLCGNMYHESDNKAYDGITVWWFSPSGEMRFPDKDTKLANLNGNNSTNIPAILDICPNCFERFYNWIKMSRDENFPMNKPE